ncbi:Octopine permease ATP-binding protein P, partial [Durusdinium trenchii]
GWLLHAEDSFDLVNDYDSRNAIVGKFQKVLQDQRKLVMALKSFSFWSGIVIPWITIIATGFYIAAAGKLVTEGELSLGSFLATINLYKDLGDRFLGIFSDFEALSEVIDPLSVLTVQFNLETDLPQRMAAHEEHEQYMFKFLSSPPAAPDVDVIYDTIPIYMKDVVLRRRTDREEASASPRKSSLFASAPQGSLIFVCGKAGSGKRRLLSMITTECLPDTGQVLVPPHLRVVHVSSTPSFVKSMGLYANLVFGVHPSPDYLVYANMERVGKILKRLSLDQSWLYQATWKDSESAVPHFSLEEEEEPEHEDDHYLGHEQEEGSSLLPEEEAWYDKVSRSEAKRLHLARAFIASPEVLVLHSPLNDLDDNLAQDVVQLLRDFVDERGLELDPSTKHRRRKRTVFFSANDVFGEFKETADFTCSLGDESEIKFEARDKSKSQGWWGCAA